MINGKFEPRLTKPTTLAMATLSFEIFQVSCIFSKFINVCNLLKILLPHTALIHCLSMPEHPSKSYYSRQKYPKRIGLKTWSWLRVKVIACVISWSESEKEQNLQGWLTKKVHSLEYNNCNTILWKHTCYDVWVFQNFQDKPRKFSEVFTKAFPQ